MIVVKNEYIGLVYVEKKMGTRLRNVKKEYKLGGKDKLTDILIKKSNNVLRSHDS